MRPPHPPQDCDRVPRGHAYDRTRSPARAGVEPRARQRSRTGGGLHQPRSRRPLAPRRARRQVGRSVAAASRSRPAERQTPVSTTSDALRQTGRLGIGAPDRAVQFEPSRSSPLSMGGPSRQSPRFRRGRRRGSSQRAAGVAPSPERSRRRGGGVRMPSGGPTPTAEAPRREGHVDRVV
jgi:hypothetical protein